MNYRWKMLFNRHSTVISANHSRTLDREEKSTLNQLIATNAPLAELRIISTRQHWNATHRNQKFEEKGSRSFMKYLKLEPINLSFFAGPDTHSSRSDPQWSKHDSLTKTFRHFQKLLSARTITVSCMGTTMFDNGWIGPGYFITEPTRKSGLGSQR